MCRNVHIVREVTRVALSGVIRGLGCITKDYTWGVSSGVTHQGGGVSSGVTRQGGGVSSGGYTWGVLPLCVEL